MRQNVLIAQLNPKNGSVEQPSNVFMIDNPDHFTLIYAHGTSGGKVFFHPMQNKLEKTHNQQVAIFLAKLGYQVWLLPPSNQPNSKTADAWLENEKLMIEFKHCQTPTATAIDKAIQKAKKQAKHILLDIDCEIILEKLIEGIENRCQRAENQLMITSIWLRYQGSLFRFGREEIVSKK